MVQGAGNEPQPPFVVKQLPCGFGLKAFVAGSRKSHKVSASLDLYLVVASI